MLFFNVCVFFFFFFKQKTAYEMRISDWSSDVCSSDLLAVVAHAVVVVGVLAATGKHHQAMRAVSGRAHAIARWSGMRSDTLPKIGRASCRERVCQYV